VISFLQAVAADYEQALRETDRLRQGLSRTEAILNEHREHEKSLKTTLVAAQELTDDIKASAAAKRTASSARPRGGRICCSRRPKRVSRTSSARSTASS
jgi:cell division septum initiation protein DivIVA